MFTTFDLLDADPTGYTAKQIKEELFIMDMNIKRAMDAGLSPDDMAVAQQVRAATQAATAIVERLSQPSL